MSSITYVTISCIYPFELTITIEALRFYLVTMEASSSPPGTEPATQNPIGVNQMKGRICLLSENHSLQTGVSRYLEIRILVFLEANR